MKIANLTFSEASDLLSQYVGTFDEAGSWSVWSGEQEAFGLGLLPFVGLRRAQPWCEILVFHSPPVDSWLVVTVRPDREVNGEFPARTSTEDLLAILAQLTEISSDGAESKFPRILKVGRFAMILTEWVV
jgi:hypothetical protein